MLLNQQFFWEFQRPSTAATTFGSRIIHKDRKMDLDSDSEDENAEREALADLNDLKAIRKEEDFKPVEGMPGMYYKVRLRYNCVQFTGIIKINNQLFPLLRNQHVSSPSVLLCWNVYYLSLIVCELFAILMVERNSLVICYCSYRELLISCFNTAEIPEQPSGGLPQQAVLHATTHPHPTTTSKPQEADACGGTRAALLHCAVSLF